MLRLSSGQRNYSTARKMEAVCCCKTLVLSQSEDKNSCILPKYSCILPKYSCILPKYSCILPKYSCILPTNYTASCHCRPNCHNHRHSLPVQNNKQLASWEFRSARLFFGPFYITEKKFSRNLVTKVGYYTALRLCMDHVSMVMLQYARVERRLPPVGSWNYVQ